MLGADTRRLIAARDLHMTAPAPLTLDLGPDWMAAEMPPGYGNRLAEIQRLTADLHAMTRFGRLLSAVGPPLAEAVRDLFTGLGFDAGILDGSNGTALAVRLDAWSRLLLQISSVEEVIERRNTEIARVFQLLHEIADDHDRVVFVTNGDPGLRPAERRDALAADAREFLTRMGASHLPASTLFALWKLSLDEPERAREELQRLHRHAGGTFELPPSVRLA